MNTIVIDCGASFIKGAIFKNGSIKKQIRRQSPAIHGKEAILQAVQIQTLLPLVRQMILELAGTEKAVRLCISNEMHGFLLARKDGTPYTDYISWQKEYGAVEIEKQTSVQILNSPQWEADILHTGMPLRAGLPSCNLLYLSRKGYLKECGEQLYFYTLGDYILRMLSGEEPVCHPTNAAATGLYHLENGSWSRELIGAAGGKDLVFPKIGVREQSFDLAGLRICALPAIGDQQAALLGAGLVEENTMSFNLGTGAQVSKLVSVPIYQTEYQIRPYFNGKYLKTIPFLPSGRALNVYIRFFQDILQRFQVEVPEQKLWEVLLAAERQSDGGQIACDLSFYENAATSHTRGTIGNIGEYSLTIGNLMSAVFEQMSRNFIRAAETVEGDRDKINKIIFSGGVACKIDKIRENILEYYGGRTAAETVTGETFLGLYTYSKREEETYE